MAQEKAAEIIDLNASREAPGLAQAQSAGEFLAASRRSMGASLTTVSAATNVKIEHLEAIEATNPHGLPATVYVIGFVKVYAQFLGLDAESVAKRFKKDIGAEASAVVAPIHNVAVPSSSPHTSSGARWVSIFGIIAILIFVFWITVQFTGNAGDRGQAPIVAAEQAVRLGAAPVAAPELRPRSNVPTTVTVSRPAVNEPAAQNIIQPTKPTPKPVSNRDGAAINPPPQSSSEATHAAATPEFSETTRDDEEVRIAADGPAPELAASEQSSDAPALFLAPPVTDTPSSAVPGLRSEPAPERAALLALPDLVTAPIPITVNAKLIRSLAPRYPNQCTRNAAPLESVTVVFDVTIKGRAANARIVQSSNACFENAAMATIRRWRFDPKTIDGASRLDIGKQATLNFRR